MNEKEHEYCDRLAYKNLVVGYSWGILSFGVPAGALWVLIQYVVEGNYVEWAEANHFWAGVMVGITMLGVKGFRYLGVERHDPKRKKKP